MSRIWRYVLATDAGMAPCIDNGILTLTCCKPRIRRNTQTGDWIIGFEPKRLGGKVAYAGQVSRVLSLGDYELEYRGRADAIYRLDHARNRKGSFIVLAPEYHNDAGSRTRDLNGLNALVFAPFWYWGRNAVKPPGELGDLAHHYVGESHKNSSPEKIEVLKDWLRSTGQSGVRGESRDPFPEEALHRIDGELGRGSVRTGKRSKCC
jgi:hypothetical protein